MVAAVAMVGMFVSCKDYDDDINDLRNKLTQTESDLQSLLDQKVNAVESEIATLNSQLASLQADYQAADAVLQATMQAAIDAAAASANNYTDAAQAAAQAYADVQAAAAEAAAIAAAEALVQEAINTLQGALDEAVRAIDERIDGTNVRIDNLEVALAEAIARHDADIAALQGAMVEADGKLQEGIDEAKAYAEKAQETADEALSLAKNNQDRIGVLETQLDALGADVSALQTASAAHEKAIGDLQDIVRDLQDQIDALDAIVSVLREDVTAALEEAAHNAADILAIQTQLEKLEEANQAFLDELTKALTEKFGDVDNSIISILTELTGVNADITDIYGKLGDLEGKLDADYGDIESKLGDVWAEIEAIEGACDGMALWLLDTFYAVVQNTSDITILYGQVGDLKKDIADALEEAKAYAEAITYELYVYVENMYVEAMAELQGKFDGLYEWAGLTDDAIEKINDYLGTLDFSVSLLWYYASGLGIEVDGLKEAYAEADKKLAAEIAALKEDLEEMLGKKFTELENELADVKTQADDNTDRIETLEDEIDKLKKIIGIVDDGDIPDIIAALSEHATTLGTQAGQITEIQTRLETVNKYLGVIGKRLTSLVFAPTTYVNGIECIKFSTLQYKDWGENLAQDEADEDGEVYTIEGVDHYEEYLVSPTHVDPKSIAKLTFISNTATDTWTRSVSDDSPIEIADWTIGENGNGVNVLQLHVNKKEGYGDQTDSDKFTIVALKATINDEYVLPEEKEAEEEIAVYSDWARLYENFVTPYIHNHIDGQGYDAEADKIVENNDASHFYAYSKFVTDEEIDADKAHEAAVIKTPYTEQVNLSELVLVCDKNGATYDLETYGFEFEFHVVSLGDGDESWSGKIVTDDNGYYLVSQGKDGTSSSREAINNAPLIQVILKDVNNEGIVDVRYFTILWTDKETNYDFGDLYAGGENFDCGDSYALAVEASVIEAACEENGITTDELYSSFTLLEGLWTSKDNAKTVGSDTPASPDETLGTVALATENEKGETVDPYIVWTITPEVNQEMYDEGSVTIDAWGVFQGVYLDTNIIPFHLSLTLTIDKMELKVTRNQTMWRDGARYVNPELDTDDVYGDGNYATTQIEASLYEGYINTGVTPGSMEDMVNKGDAKFVFDEDRLGEMADANGTDEDDWSVSEDGQTLYYSVVHGGMPTPDNIAATIAVDPDNNDAVMIKLWETDNGSATSEPSPGAKLLVGNYVPVKIADEYCEYVDVLEDFNVNFLTPLAFENAGPIELELTDIYSGGDAGEITLANTIMVVEEAVNNNRIVWSNYTDKAYQAVDGLAGWYGVEDPNYDTDNAMTNVQLDGTIGDECNVPLSSIRNSDGSPKYRIEYDENKNAFVFYNLSGSAIGEDFKIMVNATIKTKWQDATAENGLALKIYITIHSGF